MDLRKSGREFQTDGPENAREDLNKSRRGFGSRRFNVCDEYLASEGRSNVVR